MRIKEQEKRLTLNEHDDDDDVDDDFIKCFFVAIVIVRTCTI